MNLVPFMEQWDMLPPPGGTILVAVSGGRDSMCLLHYLCELGKEKRFQVAAGHLNHGMRPTADSDEAFVRDFCRELGVPFYSRKIPVYEMAHTWKLTVEEAGRRARYAFLEETANAIGADRIATAHHLNDQSETVLLHLLRGTGSRGLGGIPPVRGRYTRPLLGTPREELEAYNARHGIDHVEDSTNGDVHYGRNRLRLSVWAELEKIHPAARENIARCADIAREESDFLDDLAARDLPPEGTQVACADLLQAPPVLQRRMVRLLLDRLATGKKDVTAGHIEAILHLAQNGGMIHLPAGVIAVCREGTLCLKTEEKARPEQMLTYGVNHWGGWQIVVSREKLRDDDIALRYGGEPLSVRCWCPEDRLQLPGSRGSRSLKRLFIDHGIPPEQRESLPVICAGGAVAYVQGIGRSQSFLPEEAHHEIHITIHTGNG